MYSFDDVGRLLTCTLQAHRGPVHHGVVLNLHGPDADTIWTAWRDDTEPYLALLLPDCPVATADGGEACSEFAGHPGAHSWELADPVLPLALVTAFGPLLTEQDQPPDGRVFRISEVGCESEFRINLRFDPMCQPPKTVRYASCPFWITADNPADAVVIALSPLRTRW
ncbi:hypothetical protein K7472_31510 [Streptomyces sp. PTM05]|uniref:Uncharacterized protein n=1 Tax=Streptantibioticus parmotrematis TaxID=2873249 RepID=A0ABS7R5P8_9ACTN|nr:hypothetical protein [Streptantibioticus parmotrematis]MBY8889337.1 hypothetical protein [Streptantibioticus parmotrematis]